LAHQNREPPLARVTYLSPLSLFPNKNVGNAVFAMSRFRRCVQNVRARVQKNGAECVVLSAVFRFFASCHWL
jgi:hypothetical protein